MARAFKVNIETPGSRLIETRRFAGGHKVSRIGVMKLEFANSSEL
jgi:hypothetical protein